MSNTAASGLVWLWGDEESIPRALVSRAALSLAATTAGRKTVSGRSLEALRLDAHSQGGVVMGTLQLRLLAQTNSTITLGWAAVPGALGYRYSREGYDNPDGSPRYSFTWNGQTTQVRFAKGSAWYCVEALGLLASDTYPP